MLADTPKRWEIKELLANCALKSKLIELTKTSQVEARFGLIHSKHFKEKIPARMFFLEYP